MRPFIIGTAGHVDHGKTSLVRFLTGTNTDRLREEQERGITIELGFAELDLERDGERVRAGIVDVPGHERFVRHMVAGAGGVDLLLMVIAADEGVMPQTREHLDICRLLDVHTGLIVLTKTDLVDEDWRELVQEDIREGLAGTFLADAPIVPFTTKPADPAAQLRALQDALWEARERVVSRDRDTVFRLPIDRVFSLRATARSSRAPCSAGRSRRARTSRCCRAARPRAPATCKASARSAWRSSRACARPSTCPGSTPSRSLVARSSSTRAPWPDRHPRREGHGPAHSPRPMEDQGAAIVHIGTAHANARLRVFDGAIPAGGEGLVRLHLEHPVVALPGDRADSAGLRRHPGPRQDLRRWRGPAPVRGAYRVRHKGARLRAYLDAVAAAAAPERIRLVLRSAGHEGLDEAGIVARTGLGPARATALLETLVAGGDVHRVEEQPATLLDGEIVAELGERALAQVGAHLEANPLADGLPRESLRSQLRPPLRPKVLVAILERLATEGRVTLAERTSGSPGRVVRLDDESAALAEETMKRLAKAGVGVPRLDQLAEEIGTDPRRLQPIVVHLAREGKLTRYAEGFFAVPAALEELQSRLRAYLKEHGQIDAGGFKELTGLTAATRSPWPSTSTRSR